MQSSFQTQSGETKEICGKGFRITNELECDDGNQNDGDGCSKECKVEQGYLCMGGGKTSQDICVDAGPMTFELKEVWVDVGLYEYQIQFNKRLSNRTIA